MGRGPAFKPNELQEAILFAVKSEPGRLTPGGIARDLGHDEALLIREADLLEKFGYIQYVTQHRVMRLGLKALHYLAPRVNQKLYCRAANRTAREKAIIADLWIKPRTTEELAIKYRTSALSIKRQLIQLSQEGKVRLNKKSYQGLWEPIRCQKSNE